MATGLIYHERFLDHRTGQGHPEQAERLQAITAALRDSHLYEAFEPLAFEQATHDQLAMVHDRAYINRCFELCEAGKPYLNAADTPICADSADVAAFAAGGVLAAVDAVMSGRVEQALCLTRPPGHHANMSQASGFCIFNHAALAAQHLINQHGRQRVAIIDWDVHHGNGTQDIFYHRDDVLFISLHEHPSFLYPGSGFTHETGADAGEGYTLNLPMQPKSTDEDYRHAMVFKVMPVLERFQPQCIIISAGFDAAREETIAHIDLTPAGFGWMTRHLKAEAERLCEGRLISVLEGGYHLRSLAECIRAHAQALLPDRGEDDLMTMKAGF